MIRFLKILTYHLRFVKYNKIDWIQVERRNYKCCSYKPYKMLLLPIKKKIDLQKYNNSLFLQVILLYNIYYVQKLIATNTFCRLVQKSMPKLLMQKTHHPYLHSIYK